MSALEKLQNEVERQKRKISEIEKSIETVEKEFNIKFDDYGKEKWEEEDGIKKKIKKQKEFLNDPDLQIAIVGTIKAGKSTFINALFQENIASTDVTPETAALTKFKYSTQNKLVVKFYNKEEWDELWESVKKTKSKISIFEEEFESSGAKNIESQYIGKSDETIEVSNIEELKNKVKEYTSKNSKINYFVKELIVYLNNENIPENITIVDTPGLDDVVAYRSEKSKAYIKRANAVIVCVNSSTLRNEEFKTIIKVFENAGDDMYKVIILGTQIDRLNNSKEDWEKQSEEWKKYFKDSFKDENLLKNNIVGVSSYVFSNLIELENGNKCDEDAILSIYKLAKSYGIDLSFKDPNLNNNIIKNSNHIRDLTNIEKINSLMYKYIKENGVEESVVEDLGKRYSIMITDISNKAKSIKVANSESRASLDLNRAEQEKLKLEKNKEIEEIEKAMDSLNKKFAEIKTEWLNANKELKEAIKK